MSKYYVEIEHDTGRAGFEVAKIVAILSDDNVLQVLTDSEVVPLPFRNALSAAQAFDKISKAKEAVA